jgi:POT family proton-dependent oligopeptide transporter
MVSTATKDTVRIFAGNFAQRAFWLFILLIGITVFARLTFFHFHITWPSYGSRYFGQGSLIGNIFGVLNPVAIVFLVPVIAYLTRKVSSYWMLLIGTVISVGSIFFVVVPIDTFAWMETTWLGTVIYDRWLEVPVGFRDPYYLSMVLFVSVFTLGEAIWSPRLMQFTAEVAPPGREGSYVALAYLPYFGAKFIAGPMAGILLTAYSPEFGIDGVYMNYPDHQMIWWWVGGTAALTPIGLVLLRGLYREAEERARLVAVEAAAAEALSQGSETAE